MTLCEAIKDRHTVRTYNGIALEDDVLAAFQSKITEINEKEGLNFQIVNGKENAFYEFTIRYGKWTGVTNFIALVGKNTEHLEELCGYYGEQLVLMAQQMGLRTGWVDTIYTEKPKSIEVAADERLVISIAIGYSELKGSTHKVKSVDELSTVDGDMPEWFANGMEMAQLAPTAGNQQLFHIHWNGEQLHISTKPGFLEMVDVGIAKYHFEIGAGIDHSMWSTQ